MNRAQRRHYSPAERQMHDAQVASELCEKFWAEDDRHTGIYICITELEDTR